MKSQQKTLKLTNGVTYYYKAAGSGTIPIIFVHGYGFSSAIWDKVLAILPDPYRSYALDIRGFGNSDKPGIGYNYGQVVEDIAQFLGALKIDKAILVGHSLGGILLQHFAVTRPDKIVALILSNTFPVNNPPPGIPSDVKKRLDGYGSKKENRKVFMQTMPQYFDISNLAHEDLKKFVEIALKADNKALKEFLELVYMAPEIPQEKYKSIKIPTLIIIGTHDPFAMFNMAVAINDGIKGSRIYVVEYSGHSPMWERPDVWTKGVLDFLKDHSLK
jgi:pimeloyl-ACP methyl ester carboxylesterase